MCERTYAHEPRTADEKNFCFADRVIMALRARAPARAGFLRAITAIVSRFLLALIL